MRLEALRARHKIIQVLRSFLDDAGFLEAQTPLLVPGTCPDVALNSFQVGADYLVTSTEYQIKRLIAGGFPAVYTLGPNFRPGDFGPRHNPEFTMLEWGQAGASLDIIEAHAEAMIRAAWGAVGCPEVVFEGRTIAIDQPWPRVRVQDVLEGLLDRPLASFNLEDLQEASAHWSMPDSFRADAHDLVSYLLAEAEAKLGTPVPMWVVDWPAFMTASAPPHPNKEGVVLRSELYMGGLELADGFPFLTDARLQAKLFEAERLRRQERQLPPVTPDLRYLQALEQGLPIGAGMALGVDRLVMVLTRASHLQAVMAFGWEDR